MSEDIDIVYSVFMTGGRRDQTPGTSKSILHLSEADWWDPPPQQPACLVTVVHAPCRHRSRTSLRAYAKPVVSLTQSAFQHSSTIVYNQRYSGSDGKLSKNREELSISKNGLPFCAASKALLKQMSSGTFDNSPLVLRLCALMKKPYLFLANNRFNRRMARHCAVRISGSCIANYSGEIAEFLAACSPEPSLAKESSIKARTASVSLARQGAIRIVKSIH